MNLGFTPQNVIAVAGVATLPIDAGTVTSEALTTAAGAVYTLTLGCQAVTPNSLVMAAIYNGTNSAGDPSLSSVAPGNNVVVVRITNRHATTAFNGTLKIAVMVFN
jgi:hypothetical protein